MRMLSLLGFVGEQGWTFDKYTLLEVEDRERTFLQGRVSGGTNS